MKKKLYHNMFLILISFFLLILLPIPVQAGMDDFLQALKDAVPKPPPKVDVSNFDIQNMKLGMSELEVTALFPNTKIRTIDYSREDKSYLEKKVNFSNNDGNLQANFEVKFAKSQWGNGAVYIEYVSRFSRPDPSEFQAIKNKVLEKYGQPNTTQNEIRTVWAACYGQCDRTMHKIGEAAPQCGSRLTVYLESTILYLTLLDSCPEARYKEKRKTKARDVKF